MAEFKEDRDELNRVQSMMPAVDIGSLDIPQPNLIKSYMLDKVMSKILWQPSGVETVLNIMQKVEIDFNRYKNSFLYKWVLNGPLRLMKLVRQRFNQNPITKDLFDYLYYDKLELVLCRTAHILQITFFFGTLISIFIAFYFKFYLILFSFFVWCASAFWQFYIFKHTMNNILFTNIYHLALDTIENHYYQHVAYVQRIFEIPQQIQEKWAQTQQQMIEDGMSDEEMRNRKLLELKTSALLQELGGAVALQQAKDNAEIQEILDKTKLEYLRSELRIEKEELHDPQKQHELLMCSVNGMSQFLIERGKALAADDQEKRKLNYQLNLLDAIRTGNLPPQEIHENFSKIKEMELDSINIDDIW